MADPTTRERVIQAVDEAWRMPSGQTRRSKSAHTRIIDAVERLLREEREACARIIDGAGAFPAFKNLAAAIRSRR